MRSAAAYERALRPTNTKMATSVIEGVYTSGGAVERRQVEHFVAILDHGSFTAAADALFISQPSLSHSIKSLEADVGALLFHRLARGVRLTPAGEVFATSARRILQEFDRARAQVQAVGNVVSGNLDLVVLPGLLLDPLPALVGPFRARHPGVLLKIRHAESAAELHEAVNAGTAELGLTNDPAEVHGPLATSIVSDQDFKVLLPPGSDSPPDGVVPLEALVAMQVVTGPPGSEVRDLLVHQARRMGHTFTPAVEVELRGGALYLVLAGAGAAILPASLAELGRAQGGVVASLRPPFRRTTYLLHRRAPLSPAAAAMRQLIAPPPPDPVAACEPILDRHTLQPRNP